jgi:hypothetical protein
MKLIAIENQVDRIEEGRDREVRSSDEKINEYVFIVRKNY